MPKKETDYSKTVIYKIVCNELNIKECYVGHTTNFRQRKNQHKNHINNQRSPRHHLQLYQFIINNGGWENWSMLEIEKYPCNDNNEARSRERYYFELLEASLNRIYPARNQIEYKKDNKIKIQNQGKVYREKNTQKIKTRRKIRVNCECGSVNILKDAMAQHRKTNKHIKYLETQNINKNI